MNERIDVLALQATDSKGGLDRHKFAQLIVAECAGVCEDYRGTEWGKAAECIGDSIREHFGVEE
jgi:hypothetical protein